MTKYQIIIEEVHETQLEKYPDYREIYKQVIEGVDVPQLVRDINETALLEQDEPEGTVKHIDVSAR